MKFRDSVFVELFDFDPIILQINLKDIIKRPLRQTAQSGTKSIFRESTNLKLIGEELWHCHNGGISVYDCQWNKLREIRFREEPRSVAALDTKTVVIATDGGLVIASTEGINLGVVNVRFLCRLNNIW